MLVTNAQRNPTAEQTEGNGSDHVEPAGLAQALKPLAIDVVVPLAVYYLAQDALGTGMIMALTLSSIVPVVRTSSSVVRERSVNALAAVMLVVNVVGIALTFVTGSATIAYAKNSGISSVIALSILISVLRDKPIMTAGLKPFITKGHDARSAAWDRLHRESARFVVLERRYSLIWGAALLAECIARLVCAFTVAASTMAWLSTVVLGAGIAVGCVVGGGAAADPMDKLIDAELAKD